MAGQGDKEQLQLANRVDKPGSKLTAGCLSWGRGRTAVTIMRKGVTGALSPATARLRPAGLIFID